MNSIVKIRHKILMSFYRLMLKILNQKLPLVFIGKNGSGQLVKSIPGYGVTRLLLVTDKDIVKLGLHQTCLSDLDKIGLPVIIYDKIEPDPTQLQIEQGVELLKKHGCDGVLGFGGGSPIDAAKMIATRATNKRSIDKMEGPFKVGKRPLPLFAVPTTAGTGSEATMAAVASLKEVERKITVADPKLIPLGVALDPSLTISLPPSITAATGVDVLTHGLESFISTLASPESMRQAKAAIKLTFLNLENAYRDGSDQDAREGMALAAFHGGCAITLTGTGYVHAIAHQLGAIHHIPHGIANAVIVNHFLEYSKDAIVDKLAELAVLIGAGDRSESSELLASRFIDRTRELLEAVEIPRTLDSIQKERIPEIAKRAYEEALALCGVPKYMDIRDLERVINQIAL